MAIHQGKYNNDFDNHGLAHNYFHEHLNHVYEHIDIQSDTSVLVPVIKAGTRFFLYSTESAIITSQSAGNNCFPPSTTLSYPNHKAIFEPNDLNSTSYFDTTVTLPSTTPTYYLFAKDNDDVSSTSIGLGSYQVRSSTELSLVFDYEKGGFYSTNNERALCQFRYESTTDVPIIEQIFRKDVRWNVNPQTSTYTAIKTDDIILLNSSVGELPSNTGAEYLGVKINFKNNSTATPTIYGNINGTTSITLSSSEAIEFVGASTCWHTIGRFSTSAAATVALENYNTGWINRNDWTNVHLGSTTSTNVDSDVEHNLNADMANLSYRLLISTGGTDTSAFAQGFGTGDSLQIGLTP